MMLCLGNSVKFAHIEQLQLRVEMTTDVYLMANAKIKVDDGEFALMFFRFCRFFRVLSN